MKIVLQRVSKASVQCEDDNGTSYFSEIATGFLLLVGFGKYDTEAHFEKIFQKILTLRAFPSETSGFDKTILDVSGEILVISQFTLYGDVWNGRRPDFSGALPGETARALYASFVKQLQVRAPGVRIGSGVFGAHMQVSLINDGPVTLLIESD